MRLARSIKACGGAPCFQRCVAGPECAETFVSSVASAPPLARRPVARLEGFAIETLLWERAQWQSGKLSSRPIARKRRDLPIGSGDQSSSPRGARRHHSPTHDPRNAQEKDLPNDDQEKMRAPRIWPGGTGG